MLRYVSFMPTFWRVFIINGCLILSKPFYASIEKIIWFLLFNLLMWGATLINLRILKNPWIPRINLIWLWCMILLIYCWIWIASILLRILHLYSVILACNYLFSCCLCLVLISGWLWPSRLSLEVFLPLQFFGSVSKGQVLALL